MTFSYNFDDDILEHQRLVDADNELELKRLLRKYGSLEGIEKNADIRDSMAYMMANQNGLAQKVLTQETGNSLLSSQGTQYAKNDRANHASDANLPAYVKTGATVDYAKYGEGFSKEFIDEMLNDEIFQRALREYAIPNEGGYINLENDPGKETNMGISKRWYPNEDIKNLTRERVNAIFYRDYWKWNGIHKLPPEIIGFVFDHGIRTSPQNAIVTTHQALDINPVGDIIGKTTLERLKRINYKQFLYNYKKLVHEQDKQRDGYSGFGTGWDKRTEGYHLSY